MVENLRTFQSFEDKFNSFWKAEDKEKEKRSQEISPSLKSNLKVNEKNQKKISIRKFNEIYKNCLNEEAQKSEGNEKIVNNFIFQRVNKCTREVWK